MTAPTAPTGLLLLNIGTPEAPETAPVRRYLAEFLGDPRVIDIPAVPRWLLLNLVILRTRPRQSAQAYRKIWTDQGSPLLVHSLALRDGLRASLGEGWRVEVGMRYGHPSISAALERLHQEGVDRLVVAPLFPQFASAATGTALEAVYRKLAARWNVPSISVVAPFYGENGFLDAFADAGRPQLASLRPDHVLFSFHGLPERQIRRSDETAKHCLAASSCCDAIGPANRNCYRAQCFHTARELARRLALSDGSWSVSFQSRLGRTAWISPHTDVRIGELAQQGTKRVLVFCPAFVADCLETLEEVAMRAREQFVAAGGEELQLVASLNARPGWVNAFTRLARRTAGEPAVESW